MASIKPAMDGNSTLGQSGCPICGRPVEVEAKPFCSKRCADIDLSRWLGGRYAIAGGNADADEDGDDDHTKHPAPTARNRSASNEDE